MKPAVFPAFPSLDSIASGSSPTPTPQSVASTPEPAGAQQSIPRAFDPHHVWELLEGSTRWQDQSKVLEEFHQSLLCVPVAESWPHVGEVVQILSRLLTDTNFRITLTTLYIIQDLVERWSSSMLGVVGAVIPGLLEKLGDNKIVIRQTAMKIFHKIFKAVVHTSSPHYAEKLLCSLTSALSHRITHIRLEVMSVLVMALVVFEEGEVAYDRSRVVQTMCEALLDPSERMVTVALEALAVLHHYAVDPGGLRSDIAERLTNQPGAERCGASGDSKAYQQVVSRFNCCFSVLPSVTDEGLVAFPQLNSPSLGNPSPDRASPSSPSSRALPNAAMAMGRIGKKMMFGLEDASPSGCGGCRQPLASRELRRCASSSSSVCSNHDRFSPIPDGILEEGLNPFGRPTTIGGCVVPPARGCRGMRERRRMLVPSLRVNFKDEVHSDRSSSGSARNSFREDRGDIEVAEVASPSPLRAASSKQLEQIASFGCACEESPNYIPNWARPMTRQVEGNKRAMTATGAPGAGMGLGATAAADIKRVSSSCDLGLEDAVFRNSGRGALALLRHETSGCAGRANQSGPERQDDVNVSDFGLRALECPPSADEISEKLRLLKRPGAGGQRASSQGSSRAVPSLAGSGHRDLSLGAVREHRHQSHHDCVADFESPFTALQLLPPLPPTSKEERDVPVARVAEVRRSPVGASRRPCPLTCVDDRAETHVEPELEDQPHVAYEPSALVRRAGRFASEPPVCQASPGIGSPSGGSKVPDAIRHGVPSGVSPEECYSPDRPKGRERRRRSGAGFNNVGSDLAVDGKAEQVRHCETEELAAFDAALPATERWLDGVLRRLGAGGGGGDREVADWQVQFEALTDIRRVARHAPQLLASGVSVLSLRQAVALILTLSESLRSALAKGALMCLNDFFVVYKKQMDAELERLVPMCVRKAVDTSVFISSEAERLLLTMCQNVSEAKCLSIVLTHALDPKVASNPRLRAKCMWCVLMLVQRMGSRTVKCPVIDRLFQFVGRGLADPSGEVRNMARSTTTALHAAIGADDFEKLMIKNLSSDDAAKARHALETGPSSPQRQPNIPLLPSSPTDSLCDDILTRDLLHQDPNAAPGAGRHSQGGMSPSCEAGALRCSPKRRPLARPWNVGSR